MWRRQYMEVPILSFSILCRPTLQLMVKSIQAGREFLMQWAMKQQEKRIPLCLNMGYFLAGHERLEVVHDLSNNCVTQNQSLHRRGAKNADERRENLPLSSFEEAMLRAKCKALVSGISLCGPLRSLRLCGGPPAGPMPVRLCTNLQTPMTFDKS
jgi:hypothetical protein